MLLRLEFGERTPWVLHHDCSLTGIFQAAVLRERGGWIIYCNFRWLDHLLKYSVLIHFTLRFIAHEGASWIQSISALWAPVLGPCFWTGTWTSGFRLQTYASRTVHLWQWPVFMVAKAFQECWAIKSYILLQTFLLKFFFSNLDRGKIDFLANEGI